MVTPLPLQGHLMGRWNERGFRVVPSAYLLKWTLATGLFFFNVVEQNQKNIAQNNSQFKRSPNGVVWKSHFSGWIAFTSLNLQFWVGPIFRQTTWNIPICDTSRLPRPVGEFSIKLIKGSEPWCASLPWWAGCWFLVWVWAKIGDQGWI